MSALDIFKSVSTRCSLQRINGVAVVGSTLRGHEELVELLNEAGEELARRFDWPLLRKEFDIVMDGAARTFALPSDFCRKMMGASVYFNGVALRGSLSDDEWTRLPDTAGAPRYFHIKQNVIGIWPRQAGTAKITYISKNWVSGDKAKVTNDTDTFVIPEDVLTQCEVYLWRKLKGQAYAVDEAKSEDMLAQYAEFATGTRSP